MKSLYELLNDVKVPLELYQEETLDELEKKRLKHKLHLQIGQTNQKPKKRRGVKWGLLISAALLSIGGAAFGNAPLLSYTLEQWLGVGELEDYKTVIEETVVSKGISMQLNEVLVDDGAILISTTVDLGEKIGDKQVNPSMPRLYMNNKEYLRGGTGQYEKVGESQLKEMHVISLGDEKLPTGDLDILLIYDRIQVGNHTIKGKWAFAFEANAEALMSESKEYTLNKAFDLPDGGKFFIDSLKVTPVSTTVYFRINRYDPTVFIEAQTNKGECLSQEGGRVKDDLETESYWRYGPLSKETKSLKLIPYFNGGEETAGEVVGDETKSYNRDNSSLRKLGRYDEASQNVYLEDKAIQIMLQP